ncbi:hypothetical protein [Streptomyces jumonjinensis]|uniref:hypothetical protein n=1 Tax=Streptomyces jumonjinensis TaxID=1945 RepID=UPI0037A7A54C
MSEARTDTAEARPHGIEGSDNEGAGKHRGVAAASEESAAREPHGKHRRPSSDAAA